MKAKLNSQILESIFNVDQKFYIFSYERNMFWAHNRLGYTHNISEAGEYSLDEAIEICLNANSHSKTLQESMIPLFK